MFKSIFQKMEDKQNGDLGLSVDPQIVAQSFGFVSQPNSPLPELEEEEPVGGIYREADGLSDNRSQVLTDWRKPAKQTPKTLAELAVNRLVNLRVTTPEQRQKVDLMLAEVQMDQASLKEIDELVASIEAENYASLEARYEQVRAQGRQLLEHSLPELHAAAAACLPALNESEAQKTHWQGEVEIRYITRRRLGKFSSPKEIQKADERLAEAKKTLAEAKATWFEALRAFEGKKGAVEIARQNLTAYENELDRIAAELSGSVTFDPETGLSNEAAQVAP
jgi:hypothetical protein